MSKVKDNAPANNGNGNDRGPSRLGGLISGFGKAVREISAEIKKDLRNEAPTPLGPARGEGHAPLPASFKAPDHIVNEVRGAQKGLAFVESPAYGPEGETPAQAPLVPSYAAPALNPWPVLRAPGSGKKFVTDAYYHAYTPADLAHYVKTMPSEPPLVGLICAEAGDRALHEAFNATLRSQPGLFGATGFNPRNVQTDLEAMDATLTAHLNENPKLLAVGPIGLDLGYDTSNLPQQMAQMARQLEIAADFGVPALIFANRACTELRELLDQGVRLPPKLIWLKPIADEAELALIEDYNFYVSFRSELTWPKETFYREAARKVLHHRWLAGAGNSLKTTHQRAGQFNSAAAMPDIISALAEALDVEAAVLRDKLNANFAAVYGPAAN